MYRAAIGPVSRLDRIEAEVPRNVPRDVEVFRVGFPGRHGQVVVVIDEPAVRRGVGPDEGEIHPVSIEHRDIRTRLPNGRTREAPPSDRVSVERVIDRRDARPRRQVCDMKSEGRFGRGLEEWNRGGNGGAEDSGDDEYRNARAAPDHPLETPDRKSTRLNSSHSSISYAVFCLKKK